VVDSKTHTNSNSYWAYSIVKDAMLQYHYLSPIVHSITAIHTHTHTHTHTQQWSSECLVHVHRLQPQHIPVIWVEGIVTFTPPFCNGQSGTGTDSAPSTLVF